MKDGEAKLMNTDCSLYGRWYAGKLALRETNQPWFVTFEDGIDVSNPTMASFKLPEI